jgi:triosephosphate isomerase
MAAPPRPLIAGNWKMNGLRKDGLALAIAIAGRARAQRPAPVDILVCPPATLLGEVGKALEGSPIALGAQDCHEAAKGAHTGDIAAAMLADLGCAYVIVGHSERRAGHGETDARVAAKAHAAHAAGLVSIVCIGETEAERDAGQAEAVVTRQLAASVPGAATAVNTVVAYEPVWAIGTGRTPSDAEIAVMHARIRDDLAQRFADGAAMRILYGGSVNAAKAAQILAVANVNGALVGGASLSADAFWAICRAVPD